MHTLNEELLDTNITVVCCIVKLLGERVDGGETSMCVLQCPLPSAD